MIKHKMSLIFLLFFSMMAINSCGGSASAENPTPNQDLALEDQEQITSNLEEDKILNNQCIVIYGSTKNQNANIEWELKKSS